LAAKALNKNLMLNMRKYTHVAYFTTTVQFSLGYMAVYI